MNGAFFVRLNFSYRFLSVGRVFSGPIVSDSERGAVGGTPPQTLKFPLKLWDSPFIALLHFENAPTNLAL